MSRYRQTSYVPLIACVVLLAVFAGIVVVMTNRSKHGGAAGPAARTETAPEPSASFASQRDEPPADMRQPEPEPVPPPRPRMTAELAERLLADATVKWRAFTLELCRKEHWPEDRAVAFLKKVTWSDRDRKKQHANGLEALRRMAGLDSTEPVALAEALAKEDSLVEFFERSWKAVDVDWNAEAAHEEVVALEDAWKPNRIRWGFPLDTPVEELQRFKEGGLIFAMRAWASLAASAIRVQDLDHETQGVWFREAVGESIHERETKMVAGMCVLLDKKNLTIRDAVEEFGKRVGESSTEEFAESVADRMPAALEAARKAK